MAQVLVSAAFRDDDLFIHYSNPDTLLGTLFSVDTNPRQGPWSMRAALPSSDKGIAGNFVPFYAYTMQQISSGRALNLNRNSQSHTAVSMVSTSSTDSSPNGVRHDLLLAFRSAQSDSPPLIRLVAGPESANFWRALLEDEDPVLSPSGSSLLWIASARPSTGIEKQEGAVLYRLATGNSTSVAAQTIDVFRKDTSNRPASIVLGTVSISSVKSDVTPKVLWLSGGEMYDAVVVGQCAATSQGTCLVFFNSQGQITITTAAFGYDPNACVAADAGVIIMATSTQMWTFRYSPEALANPNGSWSVRPIKGLKSRSILACAAKDSTAYAVVEGLPFIPSLRTLDFGSSTDLSWNTMEMFDSSGDGSSHGPGTGDYNYERGLSPHKLAIIIIALLALVVVAGLFWRRRSRSKAFRLKMSDAATDLPSPTPTQPSEDTAATHPIPLEPLNRSAQHVVVPGLGAETGIRSREIGSEIGSGSGSGSGSGAGVPRANSWSQCTSMGPTTSASVAAYSNRASFPYAATTSNNGEYYSRPGQQLPIIATSLSAAPYKPFVISSSPIITPNGSPSQQGDKDELDQNELAQGQASSEAEASSSSHSNAVASTSGTSSHARSMSAAGPSATTTTTTPNTFYPQSAGESSRSYRNSRPMHEMMSPTLVNAQRILQQSQEHQQPR
ncbi:unnamed protein product [Mortierella alpina]